MQYKNSGTKQTQNNQRVAEAEQEKRKHTAT